MSRVLHCIASLRVGGVETLVLDSVLRLVHRGSCHEHIVCAFQDGPLREKYSDRYREAGIELLMLDRASRYSRAFRKGLRRMAETVRPDFIHAYNETPGWWARLLLGRDLRWKIIVHYGGGGGLPWRYRMLEKLLRSRAAQFVFNSHATSHVWRQDLNITDRYRVIHNGVDIDAGDDGPISTPALSPFKLLTVCRVVAIKNLPALVRAVRLLHDRGQKDVQLTIVGDGPAMDDMKKYVASSSVADAITFAGYQTDLRKFHADAHVYLCSSYNETFSLTLAEAMMDRMVCIAPSVGGPSEIVRDGENGYLIDCTELVPDALKGELPHGQTIPLRVYDYRAGRLRPPLGIDVEALADRIESVRADYENLTAMREAARQRIVEDFSMDAYCAALDRMYDELG